MKYSIRLIKNGEISYLSHRNKTAWCLRTARKYVAEIGTKYGIATIEPFPAMKLDSFTKAYIITALWSSTEYKHGNCPCCGTPAILSHLPEPEFDQEPMCSECGVTEIANPPPMDSNYSQDDLAPATLERIIADCARFQAENAATLSAAIESGKVTCGPDFDEYGRAGHDFWLTRNHHGAGFWDGDWPEPMAQQLTDAAHAFGELDLYARDDGKLYF